MVETPLRPLFGQFHKGYSRKLGEKASGRRIRAVPTFVLSSMYEGRITPNRCRHRFWKIDAVVVRRVEKGYAARCLLCNTVGSVRDNGETARRGLLEQRACDFTIVEKIFASIHRESENIPSRILGD